MSTTSEVISEPTQGANDECQRIFEEFLALHGQLYHQLRQAATEEERDKCRDSITGAQQEYLRRLESAKKST
uniref:Uncharacterized protein n=1 Tax=viral metagenome TaxID=1070528 RepID=A0A6C0EBV7_9ZZZZ